MDNKKITSILKDIRPYLGFLLDRGYNIRAAEYSPQFNGNWMVELESSSVVIYITSDRNHILLEFSRSNETDTRRRISIERLIYLLSEGRNVISPYKGNLAWGRRKQLERFSRLLMEYLDPITAYFESNSQESASG